VTQKLVTGRDYPNTYIEFREMFPNDSACATYLFQLRWPKGFVCSACGKSSTAWVESRNRMECPLCHHQTYITAGTIFDKTRTPLTIWFDAAWHLTTSKIGMSAKTLERTIGTSYEVAWMMLHRYRVAMVNTERTQLSGKVEIDETLIGGTKTGGKRGRGTDKCIVVIAVEIKQPKGFGRVRMRVVPDASGSSLIPFACDVITPGSVVCTDGWKGYNELSKHGFSREIIVQSTSGDPAHVSMPGVHRISSLIKRWLLGTYHGSPLPIHLQSYLEEFTFRFNRRTSHSRGLLFRRLLEQAVVTEPVTASDITHGYKWSNH
jgi:transposase-like protein